MYHKEKQFKINLKSDISLKPLSQSIMYIMKIFLITQYYKSNIKILYTHCASDSSQKIINLIFKIQYNSVILFTIYFN